MQYTEYFSRQIMQDGINWISQDQFRRMMNIVFIEGCLQEAPNKVAHKRVLRMLTEGEPPNVLYMHMKMLSDSLHFKK